jgi:hypothetical protein
VGTIRDLANAKSRRAERGFALAEEGAARQTEPSHCGGTGGAPGQYGGDCHTAAFGDGAYGHEVPMVEPFSGESFD